MGSGRVVVVPSPQDQRCVSSRGVEEGPRFLVVEKVDGRFHQLHGTLQVADVGTGLVEVDETHDQERVVLQVRLEPGFPLR